MKIVAIICLLSLIASTIWSIKNDAAEKPVAPPMTWRRWLIYTFLAFYILSSIILAIGAICD